MIYASGTEERRNCSLMNYFLGGIPIPCPKPLSDVFSIALELPSLISPYNKCSSLGHSFQLTPLVAWSQKCALCAWSAFPCMLF